MNILHLDSSALGDFSASRQLTAAAVAALRGAHPTASVIYRDLAADPLSHVTGSLLMVARAPEGTPAPTDAALLAEVALRATLIDELLGADVSLLKLNQSELYQRITEAMLEIAGENAGLLEPMEGNRDLNPAGLFIQARPVTIYGGSNEVQRNILAKNVLGLPS